MKIFKSKRAAVTVVVVLVLALALGIFVGKTLGSTVGWLSAAVFLFMASEWT